MTIQTTHRLINGDARDLSFIDNESVHLVVTSPPYWNLKRYNEHQDQLGHINDYEEFLEEELAGRLVRMFSFTEDTVVDPFCGTATTMIAAMQYGRNSIGIEIDPEYCRMSARLLKAETGDMFRNAHLLFERTEMHKKKLAICEYGELYSLRPTKRRT